MALIENRSGADFKVREHRTRREVPFAGQYGLNADGARRP